MYIFNTIPELCRRTAKILSRLCGCADWSASLLFACVLRSLFSAAGLNKLVQERSQSQSTSIPRNTNHKKKKNKKNKKKKQQQQTSIADDSHFFIWVLRPLQEYSLISSRSFIKGGRKPENPGKNHLTNRKQNLAFPHVTRAWLEPQR